MSSSILRPDLGTLVKRIADGCSFGNSICVITILRIKALYDLDLTDITYSIGPMGLWTGLEPTLGIINACLPVIQPILHKLSQKNVFSWGQSATKRGHVGSGVQGAHEGGGEYTRKKFQRLDDHIYPLTETFGNFNEIGKPQSGADFGEQDVHQQADAHAPLGLDTSILVQHSWDVHKSA